MHLVTHSVCIQYQTTYNWTSWEIHSLLRCLANMNRQRDMLTFAQIEHSLFGVRDVFHHSCSERSMPLSSSVPLVKGHIRNRIWCHNFLRWTSCERWESGQSFQDWNVRRPAWTCLDFAFFQMAIRGHKPWLCKNVIINGPPFLLVHDHRKLIHTEFMFWITGLKIMLLMMKSGSSSWAWPRFDWQARRGEQSCLDIWLYICRLSYHAYSQWGRQLVTVLTVHKKLNGSHFNSSEFSLSVSDLKFGPSPSLFKIWVQKPTWWRP